MRKCNICPRNCCVDRLAGQVGFCGQTDQLRVARAAPHYWEEPCISGTTGSGTVFFSGCVLKCTFCQNYKISTEGFGKELSPQHLSEVFLRLEAQGVHNLNLVSPTQFTPGILEALTIARDGGLRLPVVWNTGGYEKAETVAALQGFVDVFLTDLKYLDEGLAGRLSSAKDYPVVAIKALFEMVRCAGSPVFDESGLMQKGVIVRHLVLPGCIRDSKAVLKWLYETFGDSIYISIMSQYTPPARQGPLCPNRRLHRREYEQVLDFAYQLGIEQAFVQELSSAKEEYVPPFDLTGI